MREADYIVFNLKTITYHIKISAQTRFLKRGIQLMVIKDDYFMVCTRAKTEKNERALLTFNM